MFTTGVLVPNLPVSITGINYVKLTGRLGTKTPVVNTKWSWQLSWHLSILPWNPGSLGLKYFRWIIFLENLNKKYSASSGKKKTTTIFLYKKRSVFAEELGNLRLKIA